MDRLSALVNKTVEFAYRGVRLKFDLSHALFSSFDIDAGTRLLLRELAHEPGVVEARRILDAGCGTGVLGIALAASCPQAEIVMRDRDLRAVAFSVRNCLRNGIPVRHMGLSGELPLDEAVRPYAKTRIVPRSAGAVIAAPGLLGDDDPYGPYDAVVSNLPAKAGPVLLARYFQHVAQYLLRPGGTFAYVIVTPLAQLSLQWLAAAGLVPVRTCATKQHLAVIARVPERGLPLHGVQESSEGSSLSADAINGCAAPFSIPHYYFRSHRSLALAGATLVWDGVYGLPEFDTPAHATHAALELAREVCAGLLIRKALIRSPGPGLAPLWVASVTGTSSLVLHSHDLLELRASAWNLARALPNLNIQLLADPLPPGEALAQASIDLVVAFHEEIPMFDSAGELWNTMATAIKRGGVLLYTADPTSIERLVRRKPNGFSRLPQRVRKKTAAATAFRRD